MRRAFDPADLRIVVRVTGRERDALATRCREDFRTVGSWFRVQVRRAWRARMAAPAAGPVSTRRRKQIDGVHRDVAIWARLNGQEREQLEILAAEEGVSFSIWFRLRLDAELATRDDVHLVDVGVTPRADDLAPRRLEPDPA